MVREYFDEFAFWFLLFFALYLMIQGFKPLAKVAVAFTPAPAGAKEAVAA